MADDYFLVFHWKGDKMFKVHSTAGEQSPCKLLHGMVNVSCVVWKGWSWMARSSNYLLHLTSVFCRQNSRYGLQGKILDLKYICLYRCWDLFVSSLRRSNCLTCVFLYIFQWVIYILLKGFYYLHETGF